MSQAVDLISSNKRQELLALSNDKKSLEAEAEAIISELTAQQPNNAAPIGIDTPLVDSEGYPRADIDIYRARTLRKRFHEIKTDHKALEQLIERGLLELASLRAASDEKHNQITSSEEEEMNARLAPKPKPKFDSHTGKWVVRSWDGSVAGIENGETRSFDDLSHSSEGALASIGGGSRLKVPTTGENGRCTAHRSQESSSIRQEVSTTTPQTIRLTPFAIIDEVFSDSPSHEAGIIEGDLLLRFGTITSDNHHGFDAIKRAIVAQLSLVACNGESISIVVRRTTVELGGIAENSRIATIDLRPRPWAGQGLLGCHLQEYKE